MLQRVAGCCSTLQYGAVRRSMLQYVAVCCSVLQCVADEFCIVLYAFPPAVLMGRVAVLQCVAVCCSVLQCVAVC